MHISYVKLFRDDQGIVRETEEADTEVRLLNRRIDLLQYALEREADKVTDLRELLDCVRQIAYDLNEEILKDQDAKTSE